MGFFSGGGSNYGARQAMQLLQGLAGGSFGLGSLGATGRRGKKGAKGAVKEAREARGVTAGFLLGQPGQSKNIETDGRTLRVGGEVLATRTSVASDTTFPDRSAKDEIKICVPETTRDKPATVAAANVLLRSIRAGINVRTDRETGDALIAPGRSAGKVFWPGTCVKVKITKQMQDAASDELFAQRWRPGAPRKEINALKKDVRAERARLAKEARKAKAAEKKAAAAAARAAKAAEKAAKTGSKQAAKQAESAANAADKAAEQAVKAAETVAVQESKIVTPDFVGGGARERVRYGGDEAREAAERAAKAQADAAQARRAAARARRASSGSIRVGRGSRAAAYETREDAQGSLFPGSDIY